MLALFECVAQAVMNKGVRGLAEFVPGGLYAFDVIGDAYRLFRERRRAEQLREEVAKAAVASSEEARRVAREVAEKVAASAPAEDRIALELYLTQIPGCIRHTMKRADDPSGQSVPAAFALDTPEDLARVMPHRIPQFRPGADLPGRPGWTLDDLLGAGGFGEVWLARHTFLPQPRAVKFCTDTLAKAKLTSHEGKVIARVMAHGHHPNVVPLLDAVLDGEAPWLMYEYVGGGCLTDLVHRWQALPPADRERCVGHALHELAAAVGTFHRLTPPIVHRDLKPSNILVRVERQKVESRNAEDSSPGGLDVTTFRHDGLRLMVTDFGIGGVAVEYMRTHHPVGMSLMTGWMETSLRGAYTPLYASPQQRAGGAPDPRDDVHALGVIGYQMATGLIDQAPGIDAAEDLREAGMGDGLIALLTRCVAQRPERRPRDAAELAERLAEVLRPAAPAAKAAPPPPAPAPKPAAPKPAPAAAPKPPPFVPPPLEGGPVQATPRPAAPVARTPVSPKPEAPAPVARHAKWLIPFRAAWATRPTDRPDADWSLQPGRLPGEITLRTNEACRLAFPSNETTDEVLAKFRSPSLSQLAGLEAIDLSGCVKVTDAGLAHLTAVPGLRAVGLADTAVTDSGVTLLLNRFPDLEAVGLAGAEGVSAAVVPYLARMRKLKAVALPPRADTVDVRLELARRRPGCKVV